jgi:hypothetical protein
MLQKTHRSRCGRSQRVQNLTPALPEAPESCTGAPGGYRILHRPSQKLQNLVPVLPQDPEPDTGTHGGSKTWHWRSQRLPNLAPVLQEAPEPFTNSPGGSRRLQESPSMLQEPPESSTYSELLRTAPTTPGASESLLEQELHFGDISGNPFNLKTSCMIIDSSFGPPVSLWQESRCCIFDNLSTTTHIVLYP